MEAEKKKKNARPRLGTIPFAALWSGAYALGWALPLGLVVGLSFLIPNFINLFPVIALTVGFVAIPGVIISIAQHVLIRMRTGQEVRNWWWGSSIGWLIGGLLFHLLTITPMFQFFSFLGSEILAQAIPFGLIFLPPVLLQAVLLRKRVRKVWLWPLASLVSGALFILPPMTIAGSGGVLSMLTIFGLAGLLQGWVMGLTLLWLFGMSQSDPNEQSMAQGAQDRMSAYGALTASTGENAVVTDDDAEEAVFQQQRVLRRQTRR